MTTAPSKKPLGVVCWKWGKTFGPEYVNIFRSMIDRHLHMPHKVFCVTEDPRGIDGDIKIVPPFPDMNLWNQTTPDCVRRFKQYDRAVGEIFGPRFVSLDLDMVIVDDVTPLFARPESLVLWRVGYADVYAGGIVLMDAGALHTMWVRYTKLPEQFARQSRGADVPARFRTGLRSNRGTTSDQSMLNHYVRLQNRIPHALWEDGDGLLRYFTGARSIYGPPLEEVPRGARIIFLGHDEREVLEASKHDWVKEHWR